MRILGVDPGLRVSGYGVVEVTARGPVVVEAGIVRGGDGAGAAAMADRVRAIHDGIVEVIEQFQPTVMAVEQLYAHYKHPRTAILMGHARGVLLLAAAARQIPVVSYNATRIKKSVTGSGRAPKDQVQRTIQHELRLSQMPHPSDVADALAVALCHFHARRLPNSGTP